MEPKWIFQKINGNEISNKYIIAMVTGKYHNRDILKMMGSTMI